MATKANLVIQFNSSRTLETTVPSTEPIATPGYNTNITLTNTATGADKTDNIYQLSISLAASASTTIDLQSVTNTLGESLNFSNIKVLAVKNTTSATASTFEVTGGAANPAPMFSGTTEGMKFAQGAQIILTNTVGYTIDASNKDILITNLDGSNPVTGILYVTGETV
jgi:hypothetical protein